ncbi:MAG: DUF4340 domain-containing protein [Verrucomicrobiales bacterium]
MNNRQLITILVALGLVAAGVVWKFSKDSGSPSGRESLSLDRALSNFDLNQVVAIQIKNKTEEVNLARDGEGEAAWGVKERDGYQANYGFVKDLVSKAHDLRIIDQEDIGQSQLGRLQLLSPADETSKDAKPEEVGTLVVFKKENDQELGRLLLGKSIERESSSDSPFSFGGATGRWVQVGTEKDKAYRVKEAFTSLNVDVKGWLEKAFLSPTGGLKSIEVKVSDPADQSWKVEREKEGADPVLADKVEGEDIDPERVKQAGAAFTNAYFSDVATEADKEKTGLDAPKRTATVAFFDGFTYTIKLGNKVKPEDENSEYYLMVNVAYTPLPEPTAPATAEPPPEPQPTPAPENETPEQKAEREKKDAEARAAWEQAKQSIESAKTQHEAAVKQWENSKKEKEERLAKEKKFEGRTYIVSKYTVDWFLKDRSYFKKVAPATTATPDDPAASSVSPVVPLPDQPPGTTTPPKRIEAVTPPIKVEIPQPKETEKKDSPVQPAEKPAPPNPELPPAPTFIPQATPEGDKPAETPPTTEPATPEPATTEPAPTPAPPPAEESTAPLPDPAPAAPEAGAQE